MWTFTRPGMFNDVLHVHELWPQFLAPELRLQHFPGVKQSSWQQWPGVPGASMGFRKLPWNSFPQKDIRTKGAFQPFQPPKSGEWSEKNGQTWGIWAIKQGIGLLQKCGMPVCPIPTWPTWLCWSSAWGVLEHQEVQWPLQIAAEATWRRAFIGDLHSWNFELPVFLYFFLTVWIPSRHHRFQY